MNFHKPKEIISFYSLNTFTDKNVNLFSKAQRKLEAEIF